MLSVTLEQALEVVLNLTGYEIGTIEFVGLRDINIDTHMTSLQALHMVAEIFGELEFTIEFSGLTLDVNWLML